MNQEKDLLSAVRENVRIHSARKKAVGMAKKKQNWCRGPESNWLRPPFQGGALPMSYPGTGNLQIVGVMQSCVNSVKNRPQITVRNRRILSSTCCFSGSRAV